MRTLFPVQMPLTDDLYICKPDLIEIDLENSCIFEGYATTWDVDDYNHLFLPGTIIYRENTPLLLEHNIDMIIGVITEITEDHIGLYIKGYIDLSQGVQPIIDLFHNGYCLNLSLAGSVEDCYHEPGEPRIIEAFSLIEVSIVSQPANKLAVITKIQ